MPIVEFHLVDGQYDDAGIATLLREASLFYAQTLYADVTPLPLARVRAFVSLVRPQHWATAGVPVAAGGTAAPYFKFLVLSGRPVAQIHALLAGFTSLIARHLDCDPALVRGQAIEISPDHWSIGGTPASHARATEIAARAV